MRSPTVRQVALALVGCGLVPACLGGCIATAADDEESPAQSESALAPPPADGYSWSRDTHERRDSVPIDKNADWHVVYSLPVHQLDPGERLAVRGEVQLTVCQASDLDKGPPCHRITPFAPKYKAKIVLGNDANDASGKDLSNTRDITCTHLKHHCAVAIDEQITAGLAGSKYVNLIVAAVDGAAQSNDVMIVNKGDGGVYVTRIGQLADAHGKDVDGKDTAPASMKLDMENAHPRKPHVVLQAKLHDVNPGDVIDADALIEAKTDGNGSKPAGCQGAREPLLTHQIFVSEHANDPLGTKIGAMTAKNGVNCDLDATCTYRKSGSIQLPKNTPSTVYVSVVSWGGRSCSAPGDEWKLGGQSKLRVGVRTN